jgi:hypothetical protein
MVLWRVEAEMDGLGLHSNETLSGSTFRDRFDHPIRIVIFEASCAF